MKIEMNITRANVFYVWLIMLALAGCQQRGQMSSDATGLLPDNLLLDLASENPDGLQWINAPGSFVMEDHTLTITADEGTDFFNNPEDGAVTGTAPFLYKNITGDFVAKALVRPDFSSVWNAVAIMVHMDSAHWIKFAFEHSDASGPGIVTVVTRKVSDDANGVVLGDQKEVWLKLIRKGDIYSMLWSLDDKDYKMARLAAMIPQDSVKVGIEAQSPVGGSARHEVLYFGIEKKTVKDLRVGV